MKNLVLFDTESEKISDYPRDDEEPVQQLDPRYVVLRVVREDPPEQREGFIIQPTRAVDLDAKEWRWGWETIEEPPSQPEPDYQGFYQALLASQVYRAVLEQEATADLVRALAVFISAIQDALNGRVNPQALQGAIWLLLSKLALQSDNLTELYGLMEQFKLDGVYSLFPMPPVESLGQTWTAPDGSQWETVQGPNVSQASYAHETLHWVRVSG